MNPEGGYCDMPTQFLGTVGVGGKHRTPRWLKITELSFKKHVPYNENQKCKKKIPLYIPWENNRMADIELPSSPALQKFKDIAWDGYANLCFVIWLSPRIRRPPVGGRARHNPLHPTL